MPKNQKNIYTYHATSHPKNIFVPYEVNEKDMFYYKEPRFGSYLVIKLKYKSCLFEQTYVVAVDNYKEVDL